MCLLSNYQFELIVIILLLRDGLILMKNRRMICEERESANDDKWHMLRNSQENMKVTSGMW